MSVATSKRNSDRRILLRPQRRLNLAQPCPERSQARVERLADDARDARAHRGSAIECRRPDTEITSRNHFMRESFSCRRAVRIGLSEDATGLRVRENFARTDTTPDFSKRRGLHDQRFS